MLDTYSYNNIFKKRKKINYSLSLFLLLSHITNANSPLIKGEKEIKPQRDSIIYKAIHDIKSNLNDSILSNPFCMYSFYYSDSFFEKTAKQRDTRDNHYYIFQKIQKNTSIKEKEKIIQYLNTMRSDNEESTGNVEIFRPINKIDFGNRNSEKTSHQDAIDLYAPIGTPILSMSNGIVIVSESGRRQEDVFSTSSYKGGNSIIIYNPINNLFYRYAHLKDILVKVGEKVEAGKQIATVGKSGQNAIKGPSHLHFEINKYNLDDGTIETIHRDELKKMIIDAKKSSSHSPLGSDL